MDDLSDPQSTIFLLVALTGALTLASAAAHVLRRTPRDEIQVLLVEDRRYERAMQERLRRGSAYQTALFFARALLAVGITFVAMPHRSASFPLLSFVLAAGLLVIGEFLPRRFVDPTHLGAVVWAVRLGRLAYIALYPLVRIVEWWATRPSRENGAAENHVSGPYPKAANGTDEESTAWSNGERTLEGEERAMIHRILEFPDTVVGEIMVPRTDMICLDVTTPLSGCLRVIREKRPSRIPVYEGTIDHIVGMLYLKDLFQHWGSEDIRLADVIRKPVFFVPESKKINELFSELRMQRQHLAIVLDEYGGTAGLVTMEDILEEIVGEIQDEFDREEPKLHRLEDGSYVLDGRLNVDELNESLGLNLPEDSVVSLGGFLVDLVGRVPKPGDVIRYDNVEFHVMEADVRRLRRVRLTYVSEPPQEVGSDEEE